MPTDIPQTVNFLYLGLGAVALLTVGYIGSIYVRYRNLQKDADIIEQLSDEE